MRNPFSILLLPELRMFKKLLQLKIKQENNVDSRRALQVELEELDEAIRTGNARGIYSLVEL